MMELFSEVYGLYYQMVYEILETAHKKIITKEDIRSILDDQGFAETFSILGQRLLQPCSTEGYPLLLPVENGYTSILNTPPPHPLSLLEKMWLRSMLSDSRVHLFLPQELITQLEDELEDIEPLFQQESLVIVGQAKDGDPYEDLHYQECFQHVLRGTLHKQLLTITYLSSKGIKRKATFAPYRLEYSLKDDKFRLCCAQVNRGTLLYFSKINIARILHIQSIDEASYPEGVAEFIHSHRMAEPIEIEVKNERNGFERCFLHLSNYERESTYNETTDTCRVKIYYYDIDEIELLITLLSYGPIIKILGPQPFLDKFVARLRREKELLNRKS